MARKFPDAQDRVSRSERKREYEDRFGQRAGALRANSDCWRASLAMTFYCFVASLLAMTDSMILCLP